MDVSSRPRNNLLRKSHQRWLSQVFQHCFRFLFSLGDTMFSSLTFAFHRLYQYIHGGNLNSSQIAITAPVLTSIVPSVHGPEYYVRLYLPAKYERTPPQPFTQLNLQIDKRRSHCIAVRKFPGFAKDDDINEEFETLRSSLNKHLNGNPGMSKEKSSYAIAQYNASYHVSARLNEVWMDLAGFTIDC